MFRKVHPGTEKSSESGRGGGGGGKGGERYYHKHWVGFVRPPPQTKPSLRTCLIVSPIAQTGCDGPSFVDGLIDNDENVGSASF